MSAQLVAGLVIATGMLISGGLLAVVSGLRYRHPRLADAIDELDGHPATRTISPPVVATSGSERAGLWLYRHTPVPLTEAQVRMLELRNKPIAEFFADKLVMALLGAAVPTVLGAVALVLLGGSFVVPTAAALAGLVIGFFLPDLMLRQDSTRARVDAQETLFSYFDLVTLERLANLSATQALESAADVSDNPLFVSIRTALLRARLEQQAPYAELRRLGDRLRLPQLADIADVMQLDEQGAAVAGTLRARVRELRDAHLTAGQMAAHEVSERMTVFMAVPAMVFGLIFLVPPLLRLLGV